MAVVVNLGILQVNAIENCSGIFFGENAQPGWDSHSKTNQALGQIMGNCNQVTAPLNLINDPDLIDSPINDQDLSLITSPLILKGI